MTRHDWRRGLLVSVRDAGEAAAAVAGGAAIIDVKEPARGPLGRADAAATAAVISVSRGRPVTVAAGELAAGPAAVLQHLEEIASELKSGDTLPRGVKAGPAGMDLSRWRRCYERLLARLPGGVEAVAVAYADWQQAAAPRPDAIAAAAAAAGARTLLVDTLDKQGPGLFPLLGPAGVGRLVATAKRQGLTVALAGRLRAADVAAAFAAGADVVGVRSAACGGDREGVVSSDCVQKIATLAGSRRLASSPAEPGS